MKILKITEQYNVGSAKYVVSYFTGKIHADRSEFYDVALFKNRKKKDIFIKELRSEQRAAGQ